MDEYEYVTLSIRVFNDIDESNISSFSIHISSSSSESYV